MADIQHFELTNNLLVAHKAHATVVTTMLENLDINKRDSKSNWRDLSVNDLVERAEAHIHADDAGYIIATTEDLEHALTRLAMALVKLEEECQSSS